MKVLMINKFFFLKGGAERVMFDTIEVLEKNGHTVIPFSTKHEKNIQTPYAEFFVDYVDFSKTEGVIKGLKNLYSFKTQKNLEALIRQEKPDVAHIHNSYFHISPSIFRVLKKYNIPVVMTVHDYNLICPNYKLFTKGSPCEQCKRHKYYNAIKNNCSGSSILKSIGLAGTMVVNKLFNFYEEGVNAYITPSAFMKEKLTEWGYAPAPMYVVNNPVDTSDVSVGNVKKGDYIIYAGRFSSEKGIPVLIKALQRIPDVPAKIIGDGPLRPLVESMTQDMPHVEILPYTNSKQDLFELVAGALATIVPSQWYENYPMSVVESLAVGTPVIGAKIGGIPEMVIDGKTGYTFMPGNVDDLAGKIKLIISKSTDMDSMSVYAESFVKNNNSKDIYYKRIMDVYESIT